MQAEAAANKGTVVIDVRPANEYKRGRIPGAVNCEFYRSIVGAFVAALCCLLCSYRL